MDMLFIYLVMGLIVVGITGLIHSFVRFISWDFLTAGAIALGVILGLGWSAYQLLILFKEAM